uniref:Uncharacterized protein n=1 Tax=Oryza barthii TaxID=65489 RepID=A0A0D3GK51_9ORYZ
MQFSPPTPNSVGRTSGGILQTASASPSPPRHRLLLRRRRPRARALLSSPPHLPVRLLPPPRLPSSPAAAARVRRRVLRPRGGATAAARRAPHALHRGPPRRRQGPRGLQPLPRLPRLCLLPPPHLRQILAGICVRCLCRSTFCLSCNECHKRKDI